MKRFKFLSVYDLFGTWQAGAALVLPAAEQRQNKNSFDLKYLVKH